MSDLRTNEFVQVRRENHRAVAAAQKHLLLRVENACLALGQESGWTHKAVTHVEVRDDRVECTATYQPTRAVSPHGARPISAGVFPQHP